MALPESEGAERLLPQRRGFEGVGVIPEELDLADPTSRILPLRTLWTIVAGSDTLAGCAHPPFHAPLRVEPGLAGGSVAARRLTWRMLPATVGRNRTMPRAFMVRNVGHKVSMKTPIVREIRRAGQKAEAASRQVVQPNPSGSARTRTPTDGREDARFGLRAPQPEAGTARA